MQNKYYKVQNVTCMIAETLLFIHLSLSNKHKWHERKITLALSQKDTIQNFQFWSVRFFIYSLNSCVWSKQCRLMGTPVGGSCSWHELKLSSNRNDVSDLANFKYSNVWNIYNYLSYLIEAFSSSISSRSLLTSSCSCCLSCWSFPMCSTVFCNVTALLI